MGPGTAIGIYASPNLLQGSCPGRGLVRMARAHRGGGRSRQEAGEPAPEALRAQARGMSRCGSGQGEGHQHDAPRQNAFQGSLRHFDALPRPRSRAGTAMAPVPAGATSLDFMCPVWQRTRRARALPSKGMGRLAFRLPQSRSHLLRARLDHIPQRQLH